MTEIILHCSDFIAFSHIKGGGVPPPNTGWLKTYFRT